MALITRLSQLFKADFHAVLDQIEEPELLLKQAIREMENDLACQEQQSKRASHEEGQFIERKSEVDDALTRLDEELDVCFDSGKDDLARALIKRRLQAQRLSKRLDNKLNSTRSSIAQLAERLEHNRTALESMRQKAELFAQSADKASAPSAANERGYWGDDHVDDDDVEVAFLREKMRRSQS